MGQSVRVAAPAPSAGEDQSPVLGDQFRQAMRRLAGACTIITTTEPGAGPAGWAGLTATAVTSLTAEPPRLLVCVNRSVWAHRVIAASGVLGVNVLGDDATDQALRFAGGVVPAERFAAGAWHACAHTGVPLLGTALVGLSCSVVETIAASTHDAFIAEVRGVYLRPSAGLPLIYFDGAFLEARQTHA